MLAVDAAKYLHAQAVVTFSEAGATGNAFIDRLPNTPDLAVGIFTGGGGRPGVNRGARYPTLEFQVRGSAASPLTAQALAQAIHDAWHGLGATLLAAGGTTIAGARCAQSAPTYIGTDDNGRHQYSVNVEFIS